MDTKNIITVEPLGGITLAGGRVVMVAPGTAGTARKEPDGSWVVYVKTLDGEILCPAVIDRQIEVQA